ncbi:hypothetical protein D3C85_1282040 [compost metagenome]
MKFAQAGFEPALHLVQRPVGGGIRQHDEHQVIGDIQRLLQTLVNADGQIQDHHVFVAQCHALQLLEQPAAIFGHVLLYALHVGDSGLAIRHKLAITSAGQANVAPVVVVQARLSNARYGFLNAEMELQCILRVQIDRKHLTALAGAQGAGQHRRQRTSAHAPLG